MCKPTSTLENLARLAAKPGVQSTLVLSTSDGFIIKSTGLLADSAISSSPDPSLVGNNPPQDIDASSTTLPRNSNNLYEGGEGRTKSAEHVAKMVFSFVAAAKDFAEGMEKGDDAKLLRMRTRKQEIVIVPGKPSDSGLHRDQKVTVGFSRPSGIRIPILTRGSRFQVSFSRHTRRSVRMNYVLENVQMSSIATVAPRDPPSSVQ